MTATDLTFTAANNSPVVAVDPTDARFAVLAHRADAPEFGCELAVSGNGGRGWVAVDPVPELPAGAERCYAPEVVFDRHGTLYYLFIGLAGAGNQPSGVFLTTSTDNGRSFRPPWQVVGPLNYMARLAIDREDGELGRLHLTWLHASVDPPLGGLAAVPNPILAAHSDDGGRTFSTPVEVRGPGRVVAPALVVGTDRSVHIGYYDLGEDARDYQGLEGPPWEGTWSVVVSSSYDGGDRFQPGVVVYDRVVPTERVMLIYTMPSPALGAGPGGLAYAAWADARGGYPEMLFARSGDGGRSWEAPRPLNDDVFSGRPVARELPRIGVAPDGRVDVGWLDRRNDPENLRYDVYATWSTDAGRTFAPNVRITAESSDSRIGQGYQIPSAAGLRERGSRLAIYSSDAAALLAWPDTHNASIGTVQQDIFSARLAFADPGPGGGDGGGPSAVLLVALAGGAVVAGLVLLGALRRRGPRVTTD